MNAWRNYINHGIDVSKELDADFNIPKIHLISHWVEQIRGYGALQRYSAEIYEQVHNTNLKDGWSAYNHNLSSLPQVINFPHRILHFKIRELNLQALAQRRETSAATYKVLPSSADLAALLISQLYAKPESIGPQNRRDGKDPDAVINDFRALPNNMQDATHCVIIYNGPLEFIMYKSRNKPYISAEQLHAMELCIYLCIKIQVEGLKGERISQICRCTGSQSWRGWDQQNDWVWVQQCPGRCYGSLNGHLLCQLH